MKFNMTHKHLPTEMARIGNVADCEARIYSNEGPIPHFHLVRLQDNAEAIVRIDCAEYFSHDNRKSFVLNSLDKKDLIKWLNSMDDSYKALNIDISVYQNICVLWNQNNPNFKINVNLEMPDYTKL